MQGSEHSDALELGATLEGRFCSPFDSVSDGGGVKSELAFFPLSHMPPDGRASLLCVE